jgi:glycosyltransferase involved in cell wall biosynthesis
MDKELAAIMIGKIYNKKRMQLSEVVRKRPPVGIVGMFPPPLNGMSAVTMAIAKLLEQRAVVRAIDCSPGVYNLRSTSVRVVKFTRVLRNFVVFLRWAIANPSAPVYLAVSGQLGQIYDMVFVSCARIGTRKIYLHHHGYRYIDQHWRVSALLFRLSGKNAVHIVACDGMAADLKHRYPAVRATRRLSGAISLAEWGTPPHPRQSVRTVGFLSNISQQKGIHEFVILAETCHAQIPSVGFVVAGQFQDAETAVFVAESTSRIANLKYVGPVYGEDKRMFLDQIDVLVFPTQIESEGLVIHEAHSRGAPVIARRRGCIREIVDAELTLDCDDAHGFAQAALLLIGRWIADPQKFSELSAAVIEKFALLQSETKMLGAQMADEIAA